MCDPESADLSIEARLRACVVLANTPQQTALQTRMLTTASDLDPFSPSVLVALTPPFCEMLVDHVQAVRFALGHPGALRPAPVPIRAGLRLCDVAATVCHAHPEELSALWRIEQQALDATGCHGLLWNDDRTDDQSIVDTIEALVLDVPTGATSRADGGLTFEVARRLLDETRRSSTPVGAAATVVRNVYARVSYYFGLARGWHTAQRVWGGAR